jgi:hypothetical protein
VIRRGQTPLPIAVILLFAVAAVAGCAAAVPTGMIPPASTASSLLSTTTVTSDLSGTNLPPVPGQTTTTVAIIGGGASLSGTVNGPPGPVAGADVHLERITSTGVAAADAVTGADGSWSMPGLLGGRYRVRAWRAPDLDLTTPAIFFLGGTEARVVPLQLTSFTGVMTSAAVNPAPVAEVPFNIAVVVSSGAVDTNGVARANPAAFVKVQLSATSDMTLNSLNPGYADATGRVEWNAVCHTPGPLGVSIVINDAQAVVLNLPPCNPGAAPPSSTGTGPPTSRPVTSTTG